MASIAKLFKNRLFLAFLGVVFLSLFIWFVGPMLGYQRTSPLESKYNRLLAIAGMSLMWFVFAITRFIRSRRRNAQMLDSLASEQISESESASAEELKVLQSKMQEAVDTLKSRNFSRSGGSRFIYELPWYVIIGPPGAGKTTLLSNSGLDFPLEETHGKFSVKGIGGTRNCDWWFTDQAVLLDTAGRYATQDSEAAVDKAAWTGFLKMLGEKRSRRPINGVLLALSIEDILTGDDAQLEQTAKTLRTRIDELYNVLGIAPPVYLMFTKCDLLAGFSEYFADLDKPAREQVWGHTLHVEESDPVAVLNQGMNALSAQLNQQTINKLQGELSQQNREQIYGFPMQFNYAQQRIRVFTESLAAQSKLLQTVLFRGVYFTSATQTGSVLDQVISNVSQSFGINDSIASQDSGEGRSYFIHRLLSDVVFKESGLAGTNLKTERRLKRLQWGAAALISSIALGLLALWSGSYVQNRQLLSDVETATAGLSSSINSLNENSLTLLDTNIALNKARALALINHADGDNNGLLIKRAGLYQGDKVSALAGKKYDELLIETLLPRLMVRLEHQMHAQNDNSEFLFEALKTYQMLGLQERFESDDVIGWYNFDMDNTLPPETSDSARAELKSHINRLFRQRPRPLPRPLDKSLIRQYQLFAANTSLSARAYNRIRNSALRDLNSHIRLTESIGADLPRVFTRQDGVSLDQSLQSFFTRQGYESIFLPASKDISQSLAEDSWVLGGAAELSSQSVSLEQLQTAVKDQYYQDYIDQWETFFSQLSMRSISGLQQAAELVSLVSDADSPLKKLLVIAGLETTLTKPINSKPADENSGADNRASELGSLLGTTSSPAAEAVVLDPVTQHFSTLHALVNGFDTNTSPLDTVLQQLAELNLQLLPMAQAPEGSIDTQLNGELAINMQKLNLKADRLAEPMASIVAGLSNEIGDVVGGGFCQQLDSAWKTDVLPFYQRAIRGRYPVNRKSLSDIALTDFGLFFGHGGTIDSYVNTYLTDQVRRDPGQWSWVGNGSPVCLSDNALKQLALADDIKQTFFSQGGKLPSFRFDINPNVPMSADIDKLFLNIGGGPDLTITHGLKDGPTSFSWPTASNNTQVNLRVEPVILGSVSSHNLNGPWSILRLFEQGRRSASRGGLTVIYNFGGRDATLQLTSSSFNPLNSVSLRNFRAPESL